MNIGQFNLNGESKDFPGRRNLVSKYEGGTAKYESDISRLVLLLVMLIAAIIGGYINSVSDQPVRVVKRSIDKSLKRSFMASLEGETSLKDSILSVYRIRQQYHPNHGISMISNARSSQPAPFNALMVFELISRCNNIIEHDKEDMYGYGTRHFSGSFKLPEDDASVANIFEYWIDMRSRLPVRVNIVKIERNVSTDSEGNSVSKEMYITIRYFNWH